MFIELLDISGQNEISNKFLNSQMLNYSNVMIDRTWFVQKKANQIAVFTQIVANNWIEWNKHDSPSLRSHK